MFYKISKLLRKTAKFGTKITLTKQKFSESNLWVGYRSFTWKGFCCSFTSSSCLHEGENPFCTRHFPSKNWQFLCLPSVLLWSMSNLFFLYWSPSSLFSFWCCFIEIWEHAINHPFSDAFVFSLSYSGRTKTPDKICYNFLLLSNLLKLTL